MLATSECPNAALAIERERVVGTCRNVYDPLVCERVYGLGGALPHRAALPKLGLTQLEPSIATTREDFARRRQKDCMIVTRGHLGHCPRRRREFDCRARQLPQSGVLLRAAT
jgi:hypothetical protein